MNNYIGLSVGRIRHLHMHFVCPMFCVAKLVIQQKRIPVSVVAPKRWHCNPMSFWFSLVVVSESRLLIPFCTGRYVPDLLETGILVFEFRLGVNTGEYRVYRIISAEMKVPLISSGMFHCLRSLELLPKSFRSASPAKVVSSPATPLTSSRLRRPRLLVKPF